MNYPRRFNFDPKIFSTRYKILNWHWHSHRVRGITLFSGIKQSPLLSSIVECLLCWHSHPLKWGQGDICAPPSMNKSLLCQHKLNRPPKDQIASHGLLDEWEDYFPCHRAVHFSTVPSKDITLTSSYTNGLIYSLLSAPLHYILTLNQVTRVALYIPSSPVSTSPSLPSSSLTLMHMMTTIVY